MNEETKKKIHALIEKCLDVNGSWREVWNGLGVLAAFEYDYELEGSITVDVIVEECGVSEDEAIAGIESHVNEYNYAWDKEAILNNIRFVVETLEEFGGDVAYEAELTDDPEVKQALLNQIARDTN
jgi:hypothetical protein